MKRLVRYLFSCLIWKCEVSFHEETGTWFYNCTSRFKKRKPFPRCVSKHGTNFDSKREALGAMKRALVN